MRRMRGTERGSAIAFGATLALILVLVGVAFVFISMYMGAGKEIKNAVDAGALNVGRKVEDNANASTCVTLDTSDDTQKFFQDVTDDGQTVNLKNINRVWAKALLVSINAEASGTSYDGAQKALTGAKAISDSLYPKLTKPANIYNNFEDFAKRNSVRMLGNDLSVAVVPGTGWQTSLMDRQCESNIEVPIALLNSFNSIGYSFPYQIDCTRNPVPDAAKGVKFLPGYVPMTVNNRTFWQVPFQFDEKPHLVSKDPFDGNKSNNLPAPGWDMPLPNAFSVEGKTVSTNPAQPLKVAEEAMSWVLTNPRQPFPLAIPHSYVHIHLEDMKSHWYFFPTGYPPISMGLPNDQDYGYTTDTQGSVGAFGGIGCSSVTGSDIIVGTDVVGRGLDDIIFSAPGGDGIDKVENGMFNRCAEMITDLQTTLTTSNMHDAIGPTGSLNGLKTYGELVAGERDFYLYSEDGKTLTIRSKTEAQGLAPQWLKDMINNNPDDDADGNEVKDVDDASMPGAIVVIPFVNLDTTPTGICPTGTIVDPLPVGWGTWEKDVWWTPGSGWNGCLGKVRVKRYTNVYSWTLCPPC